MKKLLISNFLLTLTTSLFGQTEIHKYDFDSVTDVDSVTAESVGDNHTWKEVFYYKNDRVAKVMSFDRVGLYSYELFQYNDAKNLIFRAHFGKTYGYDSTTDDQIGSWDPTYFTLTIKKYSNANLIEEKTCDVYGADTTVNRITTYTFDKNQRMVSEVTRDVFVGFVGSFKSNSVELKEFMEKEETILYTRTFNYQPRKVEIIYRVNETVTGREIVDVDVKGQVTSARQYNDKGTLLSEESARYSENGILNSRSRKTYLPLSTLGNEIDVVIDGTESIEYDRIGRPITKLEVATGGYKTKTAYKYY